MDNLYQMGTDFFQLLKFTFTTKFGLVILFLCTTIYFFTLWFCGCVKSWSLVIWILSLIAMCVMSWLTWFSH